MMKYCENTERHGYMEPQLQYEGTLQFYLQVFIMSIHSYPADALVIVLILPTFTALHLSPSC
jgi:hypothetical protein